jgi:hypothetical protein
MITKFTNYIQESVNFNTTTVSNKFAKKMIKFFGEKFNFKTNLVATTTEEDYDVALYNGDLDEDDFHPMDSSGGYICKVLNIDDRFYFKTSDEIDEDNIVPFEEVDNIDRFVDEYIIDFDKLEDLKEFTNKFLDIYIKSYYKYLDKNPDLRLVNVLDTDIYSKYILDYFKKNIENKNINKIDEDTLEQLQNCLKYLNKETKDKIKYIFYAKNFDLF